MAKIPYSSVTGPYHSFTRPETAGAGQPGDPIRCTLCGGVYGTEQWSAPCPVRLKEFENDPRNPEQRA